VNLAPRRLLLVGLSARQLAQSAQRAGWRPQVLDLFADEDTCAAAESCHAVPAVGHEFDRECLLAMARRLGPPDRATSLIYGSGLDCRPDLVEELAAGRVLFANSPATLRLIKQPETFFPLLESLGIPYPDTRFSRPEPGDGWLVKSACSEGGRGVRWANSVGATGLPGYYQRRLEGDALSVLFLANGRRASIIGFNTQWTVVQPGEQPFRFAGASNQAELGSSQRDEVIRYVQRLAGAAALRGLNSLDFMLDGEGCRVLEVNPRPSATMGLYDGDFARGLLYEHVRACNGHLDANSGRPSPAEARGFKVIYALDPVVIPDGMRWPSWSADRPRPGTFIPPDEPLCTINGSGADLRQQLDCRERVIRRALEGCGPVGRPAEKQS
jgi:predicted ATP-grasp superfamily ATP-dependent carboligase